jgi:regulatory protein
VAVITRLDKKATRSSKVRVFLDGRYAFSLEAEVATGLKVSQDLSSAQVEKLTQVNQRQRCLVAAERLLANRPHSEKELGLKLARRSFSSEDMESVLGELKVRGMIDDAQFASFWTENREAFKPRSQRLTAIELKQKGVSEEVIRQTVSQIDDAESAYRAAQKKVLRLGVGDYNIFRRKLGDYLIRRGFSYEVIDRTIERLWREKNT